ncbi:O-antigen ligase family protein, partial [Bacteroidota bacterium]
MRKDRIKSFLRSDFQFYIFLLVSILMPLTKKYLPMMMALWVLSGLISIRRIKMESYKNMILIAFPLLFYLVHCIGVLYSNDLNNGLFDLEVKLTILFIPFVTYFMTDKIKLNYRLILKVFIAGNFIASIICIIYALNSSIQFTDTGSLILETSSWPTVTEGMSFFQLINHRFSYFSYNYLSKIHHPSYYSIYIIFTITILVYCIKTSKKRNIGYYILILYFSLFIWLLGSRAAYITYLICFLSFFFITILHYKKHWIGIVILILGIFLTIIIMKNSQIIKNIKETTDIVENGQVLTKDSDIRLWLWKSGIEVFMENPIFGVGTGDIDKEMKEKYEKYELLMAQKLKYNTHNQFLDVAVKLGVLGLISLIGWILVTMIKSIREKQFLLFYFILIITINFFFEVILNTIAG